jgi:hypothetical protein
MTTSCDLVRRCHRLLRRLRELPEELECECDPAFTANQINFLERRFAEMRLILIDN